MVRRFMRLDHGRRTQWAAFHAHDVENIETPAATHYKRRTLAQLQSTFSNLLSPSTVPFLTSSSAHQPHGRSNAARRQRNMCRATRQGLPSHQDVRGMPLSRTHHPQHRRTPHRFLQHKYVAQPQADYAIGYVCNNKCGGGEREKNNIVP